MSQSMQMMGAGVASCNHVLAMQILQGWQEEACAHEPTLSDEDIREEVRSRLPSSNDATEYLAIEQVLRGADIAGLRRHFQNNSAMIVDHLVSACRQAVQRANATQADLSDIAGRAAKTGRVQYKITQVSGGLSEEELTQADADKIEQELQQIFETEGETRSATYLASRGLWRVDVSFGRYVFISPHSITRYGALEIEQGAAGMAMLFSQMRHSAPIMRDGDLHYESERVTDPQMIFGAAAMLIVAALLAELERKKNAEALPAEEVAALPARGFAPSDTPLVSHDALAGLFATMH